MVQLMMLPLGDYQTNTYLAWRSGSDTCVVIDPGYEPKEILHKANVVGKQVEAIILTHGHFDHVGGVKKIAADTGCPVYIHKADFDMRDQVKALFPLTGKAFADVRFLEDGQVLKLSGLEIKVLHTPGHTPGSVCLAFEDCLITGDTLFAMSIGRTDFPGGDYDAMCQSLAKLKGLTGDYQVYPGHGEASKLSTEKCRNPYLKAL